MTLDLTSLPKIVRLQLRIRQYPILGKEIRSKMLDEIFRRGIITPEQMDNEVRQRSIESQELDGQNKSLTKEQLRYGKYAQVMCEIILLNFTLLTIYQCLCSITSLIHLLRTVLVENAQ